MYIIHVSQLTYTQIVPRFIDALSSFLFCVEIGLGNDKNDRRLLDMRRGNKRQQRLLIFTMTQER
jgi:hypothetical protein